MWGWTMWVRLVTLVIIVLEWYSRFVLQSKHGISKYLVQANASTDYG
jgi:hypothetical protein